MEISPWILLVGGLVAMFFGYFFGLFEGRGQGYSKRKAEEATEKESAPAEVPPSAPVTPAAVSRQDDPGILRLKEERGSLRLEVDGVELNPETHSPEQRKRLIEVLSRLRPWVEPAARPPEPVPAPPAPVETRTVPAAAPAAVLIKEEPAPEGSMVEQIDEILQQRMEGTSLANRGIKLMDEPGGGVTVLIGSEHYSSIGEVTDLEVQAALRAAIAAWEKKYTPHR